MAKHFSNFNYRRNLIILLIFLQLLTVSSILLLSRINIDRVLVGNAYNSMAEKIARSIDHTSTFLEPAYQTSKTLETLATNDILNFTDVKTAEKLFFTELLDHLNFAGIYIANDNGDFIYMRRNQAIHQESKDKSEIFQTKLIFNKQDFRHVTLKSHNYNFDLLDQKQVPTDTYNPKSRPWYLLATEKKSIVWTEPYTFFTSQKLGITIAKAYQNKNNQTRGVIGIDIELDELSTFLDKVNVDDYLIRINDNDNNLIAATSNNSVESIDGLNNLSIAQEKRGRFKQHDEEYLYVRESLSSDNNNIKLPEWTIFTSAKTYPFLTETRTVEKRNIIIAAATLLLSILFSWLIANKTSKPVENWMNQATTDSLTGLYNRHFFFNAGNRIYNNRIKNNSHLAMLMIDIDNLKQINDNFGHNIGDEAILAISTCMESESGNEDLLARFGGDEFILLTEFTSMRQIMRFAEDLRLAVEELEIQTMAGKIDMSISIGIALTKQHQNLSFLDFIDLADQTLYSSKHAGRNKVSLLNLEQQESESNQYETKNS